MRQTIHPRRNDSDKFDDIVAGLRADPRFTAGTARSPRPRIRSGPLLALYLLVITPLLTVLGGWTGLFTAAGALASAVHVLAGRDPRGPDDRCAGPL